MHDPGCYGVESTIINPVFVVKNWGRGTIHLEIDDKRVMSSNEYRFGYDDTDSGTILIVWLQRVSSEPVNISLRKD